MTIETETKRPSSNQMSVESTTTRPIGLWILASIITFLGAVGIIIDPTGFSNLFFGGLFLVVAYLLFTRNPWGRYATIAITGLNAVYEIGIVLFTDTQNDSSLPFIMVGLAIFAIVYLQYRKDLFNK